jgi:hypothetical protein
MHADRPSFHRCRGFSLLELAFVSAMSVAVVGAAVLAFRAISVQQTRSTDYGRINLGTTNLRNFYGINNSATFNTWFAPNYGRCVRADELKDLFYRDVEAASAVYALPRVGRSDVRPTAIFFGSTTAGLEIDTPASFLSVLAASEAGAGATFVTFRGLPSSDARNASIFVIQPSQNTQPNQLTVRAVWEIDLVPIAGTGGSPSGTYGSVRRYVGTTLTHYYDVFYKDDASSFGPPFVHFERAARASSGPSATATSEAYKKAGAHSFYFVWWPDPGAAKLRPNSVSAATDLNGATIASNDYRAPYALHYGQTSLFFVVPMFPCAR